MHFKSNFVSLLNKHSSLKKKTVTANHDPHITKQLREAIDTGK